jgi:hypothetical protein
MRIIYSVKRRTLLGGIVEPERRKERRWTERIGSQEEKHVAL